ncbi:MAG: hypothetical protein DCC67_20530 [Planctomycetota bacterium]|nr:MAG: hypothetical protein DCC67_20530 [Planctomycetota bacterium]
MGKSNAASTDVQAPAEPPAGAPAAPSADSAASRAGKEALASPSPPPAAPAAATSTATAPAAAAAAGASAESSPPDAPRLRIDPLELDPEGLSLATIYAAAPLDPLAASRLPGKQSAEDSAVPAEDDAAAAPSALPPPVPTVRRDAEAGAGAPSATEALLARKLPGVSVAKLPLGRLIDFAGQASGLPVSVAPSELRMAGVSAATPASAKMENVTIVKFLGEALKPLRLEPIVAEQQIVLRRAGVDKRRSVDYAVADLAGSDADVQQLAAWIRQLVAPESWQSANAGAMAVIGKTIRVEHLESVHYDILVLLERMRIARGLRTLSKYPASLVAPASPTLAVAQRLAGPAAFTFTQYAPLDEVFRYWQAELDMAVLVDWPALTEARLWPNARIACSVAGKPWNEALDEVLGPLGLAWRAIDGRTLQITTAVKARSEPVVEVFTLAAGGPIDAAAITSRIEAASPSSSGDDATSAPVVAIDAANRVLAVRQPTDGHRRTVASLADLLARPDR